MDLYDGARYLHIVAGTIGLVAFWTAAFLRKGSHKHRGVGQTYLIAMIVIMISAVPLAIGAFLDERPVRGAFLLYLVVVTASPAWQAWRAVRDKQDVRQFTGPVYRGFAWANIVSGAAVLALGLRYDAFLLTGFSFVGLIGGAFMLRFASRPPTDRGWWLKRHYASIVACGVATHIAFLNLGLSRLMPAELMGLSATQIAFFGPLFGAVAARIWLDRKYGRKPGRREPALQVNYASCSSFDSSPAASARASAPTACSIAPTPPSNPAALPRS
jgi:hypothetical protein